MPPADGAALAHCVHLIAEVERTLAVVRTSLKAACGLEERVLSCAPGGQGHSIFPCPATNGFSELNKSDVQWETSKTQWEFDPKLPSASKAINQSQDGDCHPCCHEQQLQQEDDSVQATKSEIRQLWSLESGNGRVMDQVIFDPNFTDPNFTKTDEAAIRGASGNPRPESSLQAMAEAGFRNTGCITSGYAIHPESKFRILWLVIMYFFIMYEAFTIPFFLAYDITVSGFTFGVASVINVYFIVDILLSCVNGYRDANGQVVMEQPKIVKQYLLSWFIFDVIASIPWEWLSMNEGVSQLTKGVRSIRAIRLVRVARLLRLLLSNAVTERIEMAIEASQSCTFFAGLAKVMFLIFFVTHWAACLWYAIGSRVVDAPQTTWVETYLADRFGREEISERYLISMYFTLTTMTTVGYGDMSAQNIQETCFVVALLLVASIVFAGLTGVLTDLVGNFNNEANIRNDRKARLSRYMKWRAVPQSLFVKIRQHMIFLWEENCGYETYEDEVKSVLPPLLKTELCYHMYGRLLQCSPFLGWMREYTVVIKMLATQVQSLFLSQGDLIVRLGQPNEQIYLLLSGDVFLTRNDHFVDSTAANKGQEVHATGPEGFSIPRQKAVLIKDAASQKTVLIKDAALKRSLTVVEKARRVSRSHTSSAQNGMDSCADMFGHTLSCEIPEDGLARHMYGQKPTGNPIFDSQSMAYANISIRRRDHQLNRAARIIQKLWRAGSEERHHNAQRRRKKGSLLKCKTVSAPAYFGESCLWQPFEEWNTVTRYSYNARCESRCEVVYISREAVKDLVNRFSPWLGERLEVFRMAILAMHQNQADNHASKVQNDTEDWYAMDLVLTDEGLNASHWKTLLKTASSPCHTGATAAYSAATDSRPAMPMPRAQSKNFADYSAGAHRFRRSRSGMSSGGLAPCLGTR